MKLIILDRDGVINQDSDAFVKSAEEWIPIPGSIDAIARLTNAGYAICVVSNQSGLGRGYFSQMDLDAMHQKLDELVAKAGGKILGIFVCPHRPEDECACRKPKPGLFDELMASLQLGTLEGVPAVGDSLRDLQAGLARGCQPILVRTGKGHKTEGQLAEFPGLSSTLVFDDLSMVADYLIQAGEHR